MKPVYCVGDIHGEWDALFSNIKRFDLRDCFLISVGDIGIGFGPNTPFQRAKHYRQFEYLNKIFKDREICFLGIAGNHDNPYYFNHVELSNFNLISNYQELFFNGKSYLFVGGAISIDRATRNSESYWPNEAIQPIPFDCLRDHYDIIIAHDAPTYAGLGAEKLYDEPGNPVKSDALEGRRILDTLVETVAPELFVHGHYHLSQDQIINGTRFRCLDINEIWEIK